MFVITPVIGMIINFKMYPDPTEMQEESFKGFLVLVMTNSLTGIAILISEINF